MTRRPSISIGFSGFPSPFNPERIQGLLEQKYEVKLDQKNPDYLIYSVFSNDHLRFKDSVKIFFTGENVHPDFNLCDYAFGYDWLEFGDRYLRCPNYVLYPQYKDLIRRKRTQLSDTPANRRFCNFIYSNRAGHPFRDEFFHKLSGYKPVVSAGKHLRNTDESIGEAYQGDWSSPKVAYQRGFKFSFAFENSSTPGYTTEKIVHALAADTIPIYWGNPAIGREFNPHRIINCHAFDSAEALIARITELDQDDSRYRQVLQEPFFPNNENPAELEESTILQQFGLIFHQPKAAAFRRNFHFWGERYERERREQVATYSFVEAKGCLGLASRALRRLARHTTKSN